MAIVSKEIFDKAGEMLKSSHTNNFRGSKIKYKNSPFVRCNECGYKIRFGKSSNGKELTFLARV